MFGTNTGTGGGLGTGLFGQTPTSQTTGGRVFGQGAGGGILGGAQTGGGLFQSPQRECKIRTRSCKLLYACLYRKNREAFRQMRIGVVSTPLVLRGCFLVGTTVEPLYKGHSGTMKIVYRCVLYSEVKLYTKVLASSGLYREVPFI